MSDGVTITGDKQLILALRNLGKRATPAARSALLKAGTYLSKATKSAAPVQSGALRRSIGKRSRTKRGVVSVIIGPRYHYEYKGKIPNKYAWKIEFGGNPFMRRTLDNNRARLEAMIRRGLYVAIERETLRARAAYGGAR